MDHQGVAEFAAFEEEIFDIFNADLILYSNIFELRLI